MMSIETKSHRYDIAYAAVMQFAGQNVRVKNRVLKAILSYFSSDRTPENDSNGVVSINIEGENAGRKRFAVYHIADLESLVSAVKISKTSLLSVFVKEIVNAISCQEELSRIDEELMILFNRLNQELAKLGNIVLTYSPENLWDIVQKTSVESINETPPRQMMFAELLKIYFNLLEKVLLRNPERCLVVLENADHFLTVEEYMEALHQARCISNQLDVCFLFTASLDGYVKCDEELISGITVFNDEVVTFPSLDRIKVFVEDNYPIYRSFTEDEVSEYLETIMHRVCKANEARSLQTDILLEMINLSFLISGVKSGYTIPEVEFLYNLERRTE